MVQTISKIFVRNEKIDEFVEVFKGMVGPTKEEAGYIQYEMYQDEEDPTIFIVLEQWERKEDFEKHLQSEHFKRIAPKMKALMRKETEFNLSHRIA